MTWDMEIEEIEAVLEKIWDLHDKLSDAIHSVSRSHFHNSIKTLKKSEKINPYNDVADGNRAGFVFVKGFRVGDDESAIQEAKSLNAIRSALENLEHQLEFFHTVQTQQRAERDAAIARIEQSRIVLAMRLAEHHGKKHKVIEEAVAFVGDVYDASRFVSPENLYSSPVSPSGEKCVTSGGNGSNRLSKFLISSFNLVKKSLKLDHMGGIVGNAAIMAVSMIALLHLHNVTYKEQPQKLEDEFRSNRIMRKTSQSDGSSPNSQLNLLDVLSARDDTLVIENPRSGPVSLTPYLSKVERSVVPCAL